jgi:hypothetical protein
MPADQHDILQRRPPGDAPDAYPRLRVGDPWKPPPQLDSGRSLSLTIGDRADRGGNGLGDDEHPTSNGGSHHHWRARYVLRYYYMGQTVRRAVSIKPGYQG